MLALPMRDRSTRSAGHFDAWLRNETTGVALRVLLHCATCSFEDHRRELKASPVEAFIIISVFLYLSISLAMVGVGEKGRSEGTSDRHIDGKAIVCPPKWERHIPRSTSVNIAENMLLFHNERASLLAHKISYTVVTTNAIGRH